MDEPATKYYNDLKAQYKIALDKFNALTASSKTKLSVLESLLAAELFFAERRFSTLLLLLFIAWSNLGVLETEGSWRPVGYDSEVALDNFLDVSIIKFIPRNNKISQIITKFNKINKN